MTGYCYSNEPQQEESSLSALTEENTVRTARGAGGNSTPARGNHQGKALHILIAIMFSANILHLQTLNNCKHIFYLEQSIGAPHSGLLKSPAPALMYDIFFIIISAEKLNWGILRIPWSLVYELLSSITVR